MGPQAVYPAPRLLVCGGDAGTNIGVSPEKPRCYGGQDGSLPALLQVGGTLQSMSPATGGQDKTGGKQRATKHWRRHISCTLHGHTTPLIPSDLLLLSNPASPPCTPIFPTGVHIPCQVSSRWARAHGALPSSLSLRRLPGALGLGRMISQGVRGELK